MSKKDALYCSLILHHCSHNRSIRWFPIQYLEHILIRRMNVSHGRFHLGVRQQKLHLLNVVGMSGNARSKRMAQSVRTDPYPSNPGQSMKKQRHGLRRQFPLRCLWPRITPTKKLILIFGSLPKGMQRCSEFSQQLDQRRVQR